MTSIFAHLGRFTSDENGAVTVDWVVLTAAIVGTSMILIGFLAPSLFETAGQTIASYVTEASIR